MALGENIQSLRNQAGLSQEALAEKLQVSRQAISKWETGKTVPEVKYLLALSRLFSVSVDELLKGEPEAAVLPADAKTPRAAAKVPSCAPSKARDTGVLISILLLCGDGLLFMLALLHFPMLLVFRMDLTFLPLYAVVLLAPLFVLFSLLFLSLPTTALRLYRHAGALCLSEWGFTIALLAGYREVMEDLLFIMAEGALSIPLLLGLTAALLAGLYLVSYLFMGWMLKTVQKHRMHPQECG